jgi:hypothetical protein
VTTPRDIARTRLASQFLLTSPHAKASDVVRALGAVQAQDYQGAKWALAQRLKRQVVDADIERELTDGHIVRTHILRPTWHFVAPEDLRWMLTLTAPRVKAFMASYNRRLELTPEVFRRTNATIAKTLEGGKHLTRAELRGPLERCGIGPITTQRLGHLMMEAELDGVICSGARRGKQFTYALIEERVPAAPPRDRDDALVELTRRYFRARGPATSRDFAWWSGLAMADVKRGIDIAGRELERVTMDAQTLWRSADAKPHRGTKNTAHLLPNYDEYFIGFKDRSAGAQRLGSAAIVTGGSALIAHIAIVDGQLVGGWRRQLEKSHVEVTLDLLTRLPAAERDLIAAAAESFGRFVGLPARLTRTQRGRGGTRRKRTERVV